MPRRGRVRLLALCTTLVAVAGCRADAPASPSSAPPPALGGPTPHRQAPPRRAMDEAERALAHRLSGRLAAQGLTLAYLDCPRWEGEVPGRMTCRGYVDGLVADVRVLLTATEHRRVGFDARLSGGLVATSRLEETLRDSGWPDVDCGTVPAYPARVGDEIVCRAGRGGVAKLVVATVTSESGTVRMADYRGSAAPGRGTLLP